MTGPATPAHSAQDGRADRPPDRPPAPAGPARDGAHGGARTGTRDGVRAGAHDGVREDVYDGVREDMCDGMRDGARADVCADVCEGSRRDGPDHAGPHGERWDRDARPVLVPALASALARELVRRVEEDHRVTAQAHRTPTPAARRRVDRCREDNAEALKAIVRRHAWPTAELIGAPASTAALMILLHSPDLDFQLACRDLIAQATADGRCPAPHHAYIADHCAVELGRPQFYGTRVDPVTMHPYPVRRPETLDERRRDVGLAPLDVQMRTLRLGR